MVQLAKQAGANTVLLSTRQKFRRDLAESIGATHTIDPTNLNSNEKFSGPSGVAPGGFDVVIECAGTTLGYPEADANAHRGSVRSTVAHGASSAVAAVKAFPLGVLFFLFFIRPRPV